MKKLLLFTVLVMFLLSCNNGGGSGDNFGLTGSNGEPVTLVLPLEKLQPEFTGLKIVNSFTTPLYYYIGIKSDTPSNDTILVNVGLVPGNSEVLVNNLPTDQYVDIWSSENENDVRWSTYPIQNRLDNKYYFKADGSYLLTKKTSSTFTFEIISENSSVVTTSFKDNNPLDGVIFPEVHLLSSNLKTQVEIIDGNIWKSGDNYIYGYYKFKHASDRMFESVKVYYNFLDRNGNKVFNVDEYAYIEGDGYQDRPESVYHIGINNQATISFNLIDNISRDGNFPIDDIVAIQIRVVGREVDTFNAITNEVNVIDVFNGDDIFKYSIKNNLDNDVSSSSSYVISKNSNGQYIDWTFSYGVIAAKTTQLFEANLSPSNNQIITSSELILDWDYYTAVSPSILPSRSIIDNDEYQYQIMKQRVKQIDLLLTEENK